MTAKKVRAASGAPPANRSATGATAHPARKRRAAVTSAKSRGEEAYTPQAQAEISQMLAEVQKKNDELTERVGRLLTRLS